MTQQVDFEKNEKSTTWIWVAVGAVVLCLGCAAVALVVGAIFYLTPIRTSISGPDATDAPAQPESPAAPAQATDLPSVPEPSEVTVEPLDPNSIPLGVYGIYDLVPGYTNRTEPGQSAWQTSFAYDQAVVFFSGWCTIDEATLEQNFEHITYLLEVNGSDVPTDGLFWEDGPGNNGVCRTFYGVVPAWPVGEHVVVLTMRFDESINDGWGDYAAGDYADRFEIMVTP